MLTLVLTLVLALLLTLIFFGHVWGVFVSCDEFEVHHFDYFVMGFEWCPRVLDVCSWVKDVCE